MLVRQQGMIYAQLLDKTTITRRLRTRNNKTMDDESSHLLQDVFATYKTCLGQSPKRPLSGAYRRNAETAHAQQQDGLRTRNNKTATWTMSRATSCKTYSQHTKPASDNHQNGPCLAHTDETCKPKSLLCPHVRPCNEDFSSTRPATCRRNL